MFSGLLEGHYKFHFKNKLMVDQFYIKESRRFSKKELRKYGSVTNVIKQSNSTFLDITSENQTSLNTWNVSEKEMAISFRNCLRYNRIYRIHHETRELKVSLWCEVYGHPKSNCSIKQHEKESSLEIELDSKLVASERKESFYSNEIQIDLFCKVYDTLIAYHFGFYQPVTIRLLNYDYIVTLCLVAIVALISSIVLWNKKKVTAKFKGKGEMGMDNLDGKYTHDNTSASSNAASVSKLCSTNIDHIPEWLQNRKDMIYDSSCIEKGKRLGDGNFGVVFEGKIRLGNAV